MSKVAVLAGPSLRRLRRRDGLTQAAMAARIGISPSYLNLLERNQRPLTARLLVQLAEQFDFDPRSLRRDEEVGGVEGMRRRLADQRFADLAIDRDEIAEWLAAAPQGALAFARLFDGAGAGAPDTGNDSVELARREIERWRNHFADLDSAAEALADDLRLTNGDVGTALTERLRQRHQLGVRILPRDVMPDALRRVDFHARQIQLSELLDGAARNFQLAVQIALLEQREAIDTLAAGAQFADRTARLLLRRHLVNYVAAAVLMPYGRFLRACDATGYDLGLLQRRFGVGFEQLAHRLTTLQRVGERGLPLFMARVDRAGQFSKRYAGASATPLFDGRVGCPKWLAHTAFADPGREQAQLIEFADPVGTKTRWLCLARTVERSGAAAGEGAAFVVVVGVEARLAAPMAASRGLALDDGALAVETGPGCAACPRMDCLQRALPPRGALLAMEDRSRGLTPFTIVG
ncbi:helix-turn-helix domain-containing protein [Parablastomonas sp. CN1-191]|uniref:helix-turn-helix domain-containing protein n=1 Tax=Parablastomonas sp. CN1-191 TaxID=3400908 RepID=UPI003BF8A03E